MLSPRGPNAEQIEYWNRVAAPRWTRFQEQLDAQLAPLGELALDRARLGGGERVLDVGCGTGQTTLALAGRVGPAGSVTGVDIATEMLEVAAHRARVAGLENVRFENADAQTHPFEAGGFDRAYSRFGVMFFADPPAAFANLARALAPGGRLSFVCWRALAKNPWMALPVAALSPHVELPPPPAPGAPGPFAFADPDHVRGILEAAGFRDASLEPVEQPLAIGGGGSLDDSVAFLLQLGPAAAALREAGAHVPPAVSEAVRHVLAPFATPAGVIMDSAAWLVTARRP